MTYKELKEKLIDEAIEWQTQYLPNNNISWKELLTWQEYFEKQGKRYGLLKEFRINGII